MKLILMLLLSCLMAGQALAGLEEELQTLLEKTLIENPQAPGISLCIICPPLDLDLSLAAGTVSRETTDPLTANHTFRIASNTKTYVAAAILRLVEMGRLQLDRPVEKYLPRQWCQWLAGDGYDMQAITLEMILSHTSGLNDHASDERYPNEILADPGRPWSPDDQIHRLTEWFDPVGEPGEQFSYSDDGYIILGRVIESVTGKPLGPAVRELLNYNSLGLHSTWWEVMEEKPKDAGQRAHQYYSDLDTSDWNPSLDLYGGGGLITNSRDLAIFTRKLIKGQVLKTEAMLMAMTGRGTSGYRLGLFCTDFGGRLGWGHTGFWNTFVFHFPSMDLTISGGIQSHHALKGVQLVEEVLSVVDQNGF